MKKRAIYRIMVLLLFLTSCGGPDALVINRVNSDGSIDREVILTYHADEFDLDDCQVPVDSTWSITKVMDISDKGDTTWTLTAKRHFESAAAITEEYKSYGGSNSRLTRSARFVKSFRWFTTHYTYSETVERAMGGYTPEEWFDEELLNLFYMPEQMVEELASGSDSLKYSALVDSLDKEQERWMGASLGSVLVDEIAEMSMLWKGTPDTLLHSFNKYLSASFWFGDLSEKILIDSLFGKGFYEANRELSDSAMAVTEDMFNIAFESDNYLMQIVMPGDIVGTNGYPDAEKGILWKVGGECFLADDYVMWAESGQTNWWAVIVSLVFVIFVIAGLIVRVKRRARK